jgi:hypothetical protein
MCDHLLTALKRYQGKAICYTGGKLSGKTTYATLMALAINDSGEAVKIAAIDLDPHKSMQRESFTRSCENLDISTIHPEQLSPAQLNMELSEYEIIVIDLPLTDAHPIELLAKSHPQKAKALKSAKEKDKYCGYWYRELLKSMDTALFILPGNDIENETHDALVTIAKYNLSTPVTGLKCFDSLGYENSAYTSYLIKVRSKFGVTLSKGAEALTQCEDYESAINMGDVEDSDLLFIPEYRAHYESIWQSEVVTLNESLRGK